MVGVLLAISLYLFFVYKFYADFYAYDRSTLTSKEVIPSLLFVAYIIFSVTYGPHELMVKLDDIGFRRRGMFSQLLPMLGLTLAAFPRQVSELSGNYLRFERAGLHLIFRALGWLMVCVALVRNVLVLT
jgi:hypothetical protein